MESPQGIGARTGLPTLWPWHSPAPGVPELEQRHEDKATQFWKHPHIPSFEIALNPDRTSEHGTSQKQLAEGRPDTQKGVPAPPEFSWAWLSGERGIRSHKAGGGTPGQAQMKGPLFSLSVLSCFRSPSVQGTVTFGNIPKSCQPSEPPQSLQVLLAVLTTLFLSLYLFILK